jgi:hypothetical protein
VILAQPRLKPSARYRQEAKAKKRATEGHERPPKHTHNCCVMEKATDQKNHSRCQGLSLFSSKKQVETKEKIADTRIPHLPEPMKPRFGPTFKQRSFQN